MRRDDWDWKTVMATRSQPTMTELPADVLDGLERGILSEEQLKTLIEFDAAQLGLTFDEAVELARCDTLPKTAAGTDLRLLISMWLTDR